MEEMTTTHQQSKRPKLKDTWSVQCGECFKWRVIPTKKEYEEIRSKLIEDPFVCSKKGHTSCADPADIERNDSRTWVIDRPNIPEAPSGFTRRMVMRKDYSKFDCYYDAPNGKILRSMNEVGVFLDENPEYKEYLSAKNFSFSCPKIMEDTVPHGALE